MELLHIFPFRLLPLSLPAFISAKLAPLYLSIGISISRPSFFQPGPSLDSPKTSLFLGCQQSRLVSGLGDKKKMSMPEIVKAVDPVLHEPAREVDPNEIGSERIQKIIADMVRVI
ncbi:peptide deformylase 1A, chloroplastic/mitochondrial-like [Hibiscus syriacus]|uniref:peptide deformylase 1A, chloroplastic/mitochondrial-like n=1 Tax=Hibiscus syriacus TaxID=106335 RepID=UPI0019236772|nr:peptide deformylase 1A, chloroplastic/mitochondrial-like [Hibiscus syriacus]